MLRIAAAIVCVFHSTSSVFFFSINNNKKRTQQRVLQHYAAYALHHEIHIVITRLLCIKTQSRLFEVIETYTKYYLIMEHAAAGELFKRLISEGRMHESEAKNIFAQIALAVKHLVSIFLVEFLLAWFFFSGVVNSNNICLVFFAARSQHRSQRHQSGERFLKLQGRRQIRRLRF